MKISKQAQNFDPTYFEFALRTLRPCSMLAADMNSLISYIRDLSALNGCRATAIDQVQDVLLRHRRRLEQGARHLDDHRPGQWSQHLEGTCFPAERGTLFFLSSRTADCIVAHSSSQTQRVLQTTSKRVKFIRTIIKETMGFAPYEKRMMEVLKVGKEKRALRFARKRLGTHKRGQAVSYRQPLQSVIHPQSLTVSLSCRNGLPWWMSSAPAGRCSEGDLNGVQINHPQR